ncbi:Glucose-induced degradation complex subunit [Parelaphostrongylus tenuis]|uniref:Glucose-induced degradation complex subunit n=1 Tax=Parelaphostrongylus tenuis TaxID=148309 RepID=A0AAD5MUI4_PARTN|nr:Glucose-induced degradation complex subunit [Parelaphostrongylus tenuis]
MSSSSSYSGSSAVYSDSSRSTTPEPDGPPVVSVAASDPSRGDVVDVPPEQVVARGDGDDHSTSDEDPFAYSSHNDDIASDTTHDSSEDDSNDSSSLSDVTDEITKPKRESTPSSQEMGKLIVDYLISEGYREAAELLCQESGLELPKDDIKNLDARMNIRCAIIEGRLEDALRLVKELCPTLLEENREVRFHLMQQNLIEMIRRGEMEKSLEYAQENLSNDSMLTDSQLDRLEKTFALLAFEKPSESPFGKLLDQSQRQMVSTEVNGAVLRALNRPAAPRLEALLRMIVWAQKQLITERDDEKTSAPPYPNTGRYGMPSSGPSTDTNTIARTLLVGLRVNL